MKRLLVEGGGDMPKAGAERFKQWIDEQRAKNGSVFEGNKIVLIPWASECTPEELQENFCSWMGFDKDHVENVTLAMSPSKEDMLGSPEAVSKFMSNCVTASGIFFHGGDQVHLASVLHTVPGLKAFLTGLFESGIPMAGTSAGCAVMSKTMITGEGNFEVIDHGQVETKEGFGLVLNAVLDQHFVARKRMNRLISVLLGSKEAYGIGVDEDMAVAITDDINCEVLGPQTGAVVLLEKDESYTSFNLKVLKHGDKFQIPRKPREI
jgi:cyanophycinase